MTKLEISVGILATVFCFSVGTQTVNVMTLDQAGAQTVLQAARESAQQRNAPSAIAVVDPAGDLLAFQRRPGKPFMSFSSYIYRGVRCGNGRFGHVISFFRRYAMNTFGTNKSFDRINRPPRIEQ